MIITRNDKWYIAILAVILLLGCLLFSSCNVVKKNSSSSHAITDSSVGIVKDSGRVVKHDSIATTTKHSSALKKDVSKDDNNIEIIFKPDSASAAGKPVKVTRTDNGYEVDPGGRTIDKITVRETKERSTTDSAGVTTSISKASSSSDSNNLHEGVNINLHKEDTSNATSKTSFRLPWYVYLIAGAVLFTAWYLSPFKRKKEATNG